MNVCLWWTKKKKQQKTSRFMASSKLLMTRRAVLQQLKWLINLIALQRWPAQRCQEPGTRSYRRLVNMPRGKPRRVGCLIFKTARLMRDGYVVETTFSPLWMSPVVGGAFGSLSRQSCADIMMMSDDDQSTSNLEHSTWLTRQTFGKKNTPSQPHTVKLAKLCNCSIMRGFSGASQVSIPP